MTKAFRKTRHLAYLVIVAMLVTLFPASVMAEEEYDSTDAVCFVFSDSGISTQDTEHTSAYKISGTDLSIKSSGTYILSGSCTDGSVTVKKGVTDVTLVLNGLTLSNTGSETTATAPIACNKSTGVTIVAASGTTNTLTDSAYNNDDTYTSNENAENAVIKCKDGSQVVITGSGTLNIISNGKNGIKSGTTDTETDASNPRDASLTIENVTLNITASVNDAINAEQNLYIASGTLNIAATDDAIHSDYDLVIGSYGSAGPTIKITEAYEGLEAATLSIFSGDISVLTTDDCLNAANSDLTDYDFSLNISGGTIYCYTTTGDGFDSNGSLTISGGNVEVWSANTADNQPLDADGTISITGGTVFAAGGSNGMGSTLNATQTCITFGNSGSTSGGQGGMQPGGQSGMQPGGQGGNQIGGQGGMQIGGQPGGQTDGQSGQSISITSGSEVNITDSSSNTVYTTTAPCNVSYVLFSSASLSSSETYSLNGSTSSGTEGGNTPGTGTFPDVSTNAWYYDAVQFVSANQIMNGKNNGTTFDPTGVITRCEVAQVLYNMENKPSTTYNAKFSDVAEDAWYQAAVTWASDNDIVTGYQDSGMFVPMGQITREQIAVMLYRYAQAKGYDTSAYDDFKDYQDGNRVSSYAKAAMHWAVGADIITGKDAQTLLDPRGKSTRAECATMLMRFCQTYLTQS